MPSARALFVVGLVGVLTPAVADGVGAEAYSESARGRCPVTDVRGRRPKLLPPGFNYGSRTLAVNIVPADGRLVAGRLPGGGKRALSNRDGSISAKFGWWRAGSGTIRITGRRIDAPARPLRARVPAGYGAGFQATVLTFATTGCWRITGS